jgi:hypothetical protein
VEHLEQESRVFPTLPTSPTRIDMDIIEKEKRDVTKDLLNEFEKITHQPDDLSKSFICYYDLQKVWANKGRISTLLRPDDVTDILDKIQQSMYIILSILVFIGADKCLEQFRARLFQRNCKDPLLTDAALPLEENNVHFLKEQPALKRRFLEQQHMFNPITIHCRYELQEFNPFQRLPLVPVTEGLLGQGAFGDVERIGIAARYFKETRGAVYEEVSKQFSGKKKAATKKSRSTKWLARKLG